MASETAAELIIKIAGVIDPTLAAAVSQAVGQTEAFYGKEAAASAKAAAEQAAAAQRSAQTREQIEQQLHIKIVELVDGRAAAQKVALDREVAAYRQAGASEEQVAQYYAAARKRIDDEITAKAQEAANAQVAAERRAAAEKVAIEKDTAQKRAAEEAHLQQIREAAYQSLLRISGAAKGLAGEFISAAAEMGLYQRKLEAVTHSTQRAAAIMQQARELSVSTPFQVNELTKASVTLTAFGQDSKKWLPMVGDVAAAMGVKIEYAALVFSKALSGSREGIESMNNELGISRQKMKAYGMQFNSQGELMLKSAGDFQKMRDALENIAKTEFGGAMAKQVNTYTGAMSNLKDAIFLFMDSIGKELLPTLTDWVHKLTAVAEAFGNLGPATRSMIAWTVAGGAAFGMVATAVAGVVAVFGPFLAGIASLVGGVGATTVTVGLFTGGLQTAAWAILGTVVPALAGLNGGLGAIAVTGMAAIGVLTALGAGVVVGVLATIDEVNKADAAYQKLADELTNLEQKARAWGHAMKEASDLGLEGLKKVQWLAAHGFTSDDAATARLGYQATISRLEGKQRGGNDNQFHASYLPFGYGQVEGSVKQGEALTPAERRELEAARKGLAETTPKMASQLPKADKDKPKQDPEEKRAAALKELETQQKIAEQKLKLGEISEAEYRKELERFAHRAAELKKTAKDDEQVNAILIESRSKLLSADEKALAAMGAGHKKNYDQQIAFIQKVLDTEKMSAEQRETWTKKLADVKAQKAKNDIAAANKAAEAQYKADHTTYVASTKLHKDNYSAQISYLNALITKYQNYASIRQRLETELANVTAAKSRHEEAEAQKAEQKAQKRVDIETRMHDEVLRIMEGENSAKERSLAKEVEAARKAGASEVKIAEYVAAKKKELMEEAAKKAQSLMAEMQEATLEATEGQIAGKMRKVADKIRKLREMEKDMSPEDRAKAETTITDYAAAEKKKLLEEEKDSIDGLASAHEKAAEKAEKGVGALHRQNQEAKGLGSTLDRIGGPNSPLLSLAQMAASMNLLSRKDESTSEKGLNEKQKQFQRHHISAAQIEAEFGKMAGGIGAPKSGLAGAASDSHFDMSRVTVDEFGQRILNPKPRADGSPATVRQATASINQRHAEKTATGSGTSHTGAVTTVGGTGTPSPTGSDAPTPGGPASITYNIQSVVNIGKDGMTATPKVKTAADELNKALTEMQTTPNPGMLSTVK